MKKTLRRLTDVTGHEMKFSAGNLELPPHCPLDASKLSPLKTEKTEETKKYSTCYCFLKSAQHSIYDFFGNLKSRAIEISRYSKYLPQ